MDSPVMKTKPPPRPYQQGNLDGLCGAYCIVNAVKYLCGPLSEKDSAKLFQEVLGFLDKRKFLVKRMTAGTELREMKGLLDQVVAKRYPIRRTKPFRKQSGLSLQEYWEGLQTFLDQDGRLVLIGLGGHHDHWTLIRKVTSRSLVLYDSDRLQRLNRRHCTLSLSNPGGRRHVLYPTYTYFLWVE